jgi:predicted aconitase with swiveling domain
MSQTFKGRCLIPGDASGEALVSRRAFTFAHGVDPSSGKVTDVHSDIRGENVKGRILFYPFGKGSTTASAWFLETARQGNLPAAIVTEAPDLSAVIGSTLARIVYGKSIPVVSSFPQAMYAALANGRRVSLSGAKGELVVSD